MKVAARNLLLPGAVLLSCLACWPALAQSTTPCGNSAEVMLSKDKPAAYITFERVGTRKPRYEGDSGEVVWLRLHNNSIWAIHFYTYSVHLPAEHTRIRICKGRVGIIRDGVEVEPAYLAEQTRTGEKVPGLGEGFRLYDVTWLASGRTLLFAVPREHLANEFTIYVPFTYEWEWKWKNGKPAEQISYKEVVHRVQFYAYEIPKVTERK
jgi:hypothetical protein